MLFSSVYIVSFKRNMISELEEIAASIMLSSRMAEIIGDSIIVIKSFFINVLLQLFT